MERDFDPTDYGLRGGNYLHSVTWTQAWAVIARVTILLTGVVLWLVGFYFNLKGGC